MKNKGLDFALIIIGLFFVYIFGFHNGALLSRNVGKNACIAAIEQVAKEIKTLNEL